MPGVRLARVRFHITMALFVPSQSPASVFHNAGIRPARAAAAATPSCQ